MAQSGQLRERVSEKQLIDLLDQVCLTFDHIHRAERDPWQMENAQPKSSSKTTIVVSAQLHQTIITGDSDHDDLETVPASARL